MPDLPQPALESFPDRADDPARQFSRSSFRARVGGQAPRNRSFHNLNYFRHSQEDP